MNAPATAVADENLLEENVKWLNRWKLVQKMVQQFWKRWSSDYLHGLQIRGKWNRMQPEIKIDDIVLIKDENLPPTKWALARVTEKHPGSDGATRVVTVKTKDGTYKRAITKICPLVTEKRDTEKAKTKEGATNENTKNQEQKMSKKTAAVITVLLLSASNCICGAKAQQTSKMDVIKTAIDGLVSVYNSDTTRELMHHYKQKQMPFDTDTHAFDTNAKMFTNLKKAEDSMRVSWKQWTVALLFCIFMVAAMVRCVYCAFQGRKKRNLQEEEAPSSRSFRSVSMPTVRAVDEKPASGGRRMSQSDICK